jgi:hypothetical protein
MILTTGNRRYQVDPRPLDHGVVETSSLAIDADDHPTLGWKIKTCQNIDNATAGRHLTSDHASRGVGDVSNEPAVQMHFDIHAPLR